MAKKNVPRIPTYIYTNLTLDQCILLMMGTFFFPPSKALSHTLFPLIQMPTILWLGHCNPIPQIKKLRPKWVKIWKQVNPRDICKCMLSKDQSSVSERTADWTGSFSKDSDLSARNKVKISIIILSACLVRRQDRLPGQRRARITLCTNLGQRLLKAGGGGGCTCVEVFPEACGCPSMRSTLSQKDEARQFLPFSIAKTRAASCCLCAGERPITLLQGCLGPCQELPGI